MHGEHSGWNKFRLVIVTNIFQQSSFLSLYSVFESKLNSIFVLISRLSKGVLTRAGELDSKADGVSIIAREGGGCSRFLTHSGGQAAAFCSCCTAGIWARQLQESGWEDRQAKWCCARGILCDFHNLVQTQEQCYFPAIFHERRNLGFFPHMLNFESFLSAYQSPRDPGLPTAMKGLLFAVQQ